MKNTTKQIWVNPVERISFQGRHKQVYEVLGANGLVPTVSKRKAKESGTTSEYPFPYNSQTGKLYTTLDNMITNPFKGLEPSDIKTKYPIPESWNESLDKITKQDQIKKQTFLEIKHGVEPDYYTSDVKYTMTSLPTNIDLYNTKSFLSSLKLILYPRPNEFNDSTPRQELLLCMVEALADTNIIAKNSESANSALHDWYVAKENEMEDKIAKNKDIIEDAVYKLVKLKREYGDYRTYQMAIMLTDNVGNVILKGKPMKSAIDNTLSDYVNSETSYQMKNISKFNTMMNKLLNNEHEYYDIQYLVQQAINNKVIGHRDNQYLWHSKAGNQDVYNLGNNFDKLVNFYYNEYQTYNQDSEITNWYKDLLEELQTKNIWIE